MERGRSYPKVKSPEKRARIGERIKIAATSSGLTLKELAEKAGTTPALIYQYVRGITNVPPPTLENIARVTRVSLEFFDPDKDVRTALALPPEGGATEVVAMPRHDRVYADMRQLQQLADALENPRRDLPGLVSVLHEMLALARVGSDRNQEGYVLWRLGAVKNQMGEYEEARSYLLQARSVFDATNAADYRALCVLDLAHSVGELGEDEAAVHYCREVAETGSRDMKWRALVNIGGIFYRRHRYDEALVAFADAARALEDVDEAQREREGIPYLMAHIADVARDTGHYEAALSLWSRSLAQATEEKHADVFLESLLNAAQCCQVMGKISEAKQRLEQAVVLASFLFDDQSRLSVARALLADVMVALGQLDEAKDNGRQALRLATRVGAARGMILASLAVAETAMAGGQYEDALSAADDAVREAVRTNRRGDLALARNTRARVCLAKGAESDQNSWIDQAIEEANRALALAELIDAGHERLEALLTLAQAHRLRGDESAAEREIQAALDVQQRGAIGLPALLGSDRPELPPLLEQAPIEVGRVFSGRALQVPGLEWQAHYLQGTLRAKRLGPEAGFGAVRDAARALSHLLAGLTADDAQSFRTAHPDVDSVFKDLARFALTESDRREAKLLLQNAPWIETLALEAPPSAE